MFNNFKSNRNWLDDSGISNHHNKVIELNNTRQESCGTLNYVTKLFCLLWFEGDGIYYVHEEVSILITNLPTFWLGHILNTQDYVGAWALPAIEFLLSVRHSLVFNSVCIDTLMLELGHEPVQDKRRDFAFR